MCVLVKQMPNLLCNLQPVRWHPSVAERKKEEEEKKKKKEEEEEKKKN